MPTRKQTDKSKSRAAAEQDIVGLITTLVEKLVSLEVKIDTVLSRIVPQSPAATRQQPMQASPIIQNRDTRTMYRAVCADCGKGCEVPFKPTGGRPVYCKECFAKRKASNRFNGRPPVKPQAAPAPRPVVPAKPRPSAPEKPKPVRKKAPAKRRKK